MTESAAGAWNNGADARGGCARKGRWGGWEIGAMVAGFIVFWPFGLVALALKLIRGEMWPGSAQGAKPWEAFKTEGFKNAGKGWSFTGNFGAHSGNSAFEDYKRSELERLDNERRKLMEEQKAFRDFVEQVKKSKDREEFDTFMAKRNAPPPPASE
jgi:Protein of unknown function (DUF2852)